MTNTFLPAPRARWLARSLLGLLTAAVLSGCVASRPYQTELGPRPAANGSLPPVQAPGAVPCAEELACTLFVEFDDYGNLMNRAQLHSALQAAEATAQAQGSILVYAHGWHNDARSATPGVEGFRALVRRSAEVDRQMRPGHPAQGRMLGIYLGWRGDSIASTGPTAPLSYLLTFWNRKAAAEAIGHSGGVYDLLSRLSETRRRHEGSRLLLHGHSFGAAMLYSALANTLMDQIRLDSTSSGCAATVAERQALQRSASSLVSCPAGQAADLVLLVNPAFEAMRLRPQLDLARSLDFRPDLPPRLMMLTTQADWATQTAFPTGRALGSSFASYADALSSAENLTAVGHHIPYVTHQLSDTDAQACATATLQVSALAEVMDSQRKRLCVPALGHHPDARALVLTRCDAWGDCRDVAPEAHHIARGASADGLVPLRMPLMNIRSTGAVSGGHGDIRNPTLENFVLHMVVLAGTTPGLIPKIFKPLQ